VQLYFLTIFHSETGHEIGFIKHVIFNLEIGLQNLSNYIFWRYYIQKLDIKSGFRNKACDFQFVNWIEHLYKYQVQYYSVLETSWYCCLSVTRVVYERKILKKAKYFIFTIDVWFLIISQYHHILGSIDITEILLKVVLNTITITGSIDSE
jgi:hypothetical protein